MVEHTDCAPLGLDDVHLGLQLHRATVEGWHLFWGHGRELGLEHAHAVQGDRVLAHDVDALVWVRGDHLAAAVGGAVQATAQGQLCVEPGLGVLGDQVCELQALGCGGQDQGLELIAPGHGLVADVFALLAADGPDRVVELLVG